MAGAIMCKEIKRLTQLSKCTHLSKTDRDAVTWAIQQIEPPVVEPDKGFDGYDFSSWPAIPDRALFTALIKARKSKHGLNMNQPWIDERAPHMKTLAENNVSVDRAIRMAASKGWSGLKSNWVLKEIQEDIEPSESDDTVITRANVMSKIKTGVVTHISQIPSPVRSELDSDVRYQRIKNPDALAALTRIGFIS